MKLKEKINEDFKIALKEKKEIGIGTLRMLKAVIFNKEKEKRYKIFQKEKELKEEDLIEKSQLTDEEVIEVISSEIKKRKEAIEEFEKGKRQDLAEKEKKEIEILKKYMPEEISEEEIKKMAKEIIESIRAKTQKDIGKVMAQLMPKVKGRIEGSKVSQIVKELLSKKI